MQLSASNQLGRKQPFEPPPTLFSHGSPKAQPAP